MLHHIATILVCYGGHFEPKMAAKIQNPPIWAKFGFQVDYEVLVLFVRGTFVTNIFLLFCTENDMNLLHCSIGDHLV
jgi:hypothetical protein